MFGLRKTISTLLLVVSFFVLIMFATSIYKSENAKEENIVSDELAKKGGAAIVSAIEVSGNFMSKDIEASNNNFGQKVVDLVKIVDWKTLVQRLSTSSSALKNNAVKEIPEIGQGQTVELPENEASSTFLKKLSSLVKNELENSENANLNSLSEITTDDIQNKLRVEEVNKFIELRKNTEGAELILKVGDNNELKIPLPFKFLLDKLN